MMLASKWLCPAVAAAVLTPPLTALPDPGDTERVNVTSAGLQTQGFANLPVVSADGRYVAFQSSADDLVPGDSNFSRDIFVHDRVTDETTRVSVTTGGGQANHHSNAPSISADGRYVLFDSKASNLVAGDSNNVEDIFLHDRTLGTTVRVSVGAGGVQADCASIDCDISADGSRIVFSSGADNLVSSSAPGVTEVFVRELATGTNTLVSVSSAGVLSNASSWNSTISGDGQTVAFESNATNLVGGDTNGHPDVFVHDLASGQTTRSSVSTAGVQANSYNQDATLSHDGRFVAFTSRASTLVVPPDTNPYDDVYLHDRATGETTLVSVDSIGGLGNFPSQRPSLSAEGRFVAFHSWANNLIPGDGNFSHDIFVRDLQTEITHRVNLDPTGAEANSHSYEVTISPDGRFVVYESFASNLVLGDTNLQRDVFITDFLGPLGCPPPAVYCTSQTTSVAGCLPTIGFSGAPSMAAGSGFDVTAGPAPGGNPGLYIYTTSGHVAAPISTTYGLLCLTPGTTFRIGLQAGVGSAGVCDGQYAVDFNQYAATQTENPALVAGAVVDIQFWYRDPPSAGTANLTNAGRFLMCP